VLNKKIKEFK